MKNALTLFQKDIVHEKEPRSYERLRTMVIDLLEQQQLNMLISQKKSAQERLKKNCKESSVMDVKTIMLKKSGTYDTERKRLNRSRSSVKGDNSAERQYVRKT